jgi:hypothetical protein
MKSFPDHPVIAETERFGYIRGSECDPEEFDEDAAYDERKEGRRWQT